MLGLRLISCSIQLIVRSITVLTSVASLLPVPAIVLIAGQTRDKSFGNLTEETSNFLNDA